MDTSRRSSTRNRIHAGGRPWGRLLSASWDDIAPGFNISAYSLKTVAEATAPLMKNGGSIVGGFDAASLWPAYNWMGVAKACT